MSVHPGIIDPLLTYHFRGDINLPGANYSSSFQFEIPENFSLKRISAHSFFENAGAYLYAASRLEINYVLNGDVQNIFGSPRNYANGDNLTNSPAFLDLPLTLESQLDIVYEPGIPFNAGGLFLGDWRVFGGVLGYDWHRSLTLYFAINSPAVHPDLN